MEYFSALRRNDLSSHEKIMKNLKSTLLGERNQSKKTTYYMIPTICHSGKGKMIETVKNDQWSLGLGGETRWKA